MGESSQYRLLSRSLALMSRNLKNSNSRNLSKQTDCNLAIKVAYLRNLIKKLYENSN